MGWFILFILMIGQSIYWSFFLPVDATTGLFWAQWQVMCDNSWTAAFFFLSAIFCKILVDWNE